MKRRDFITMLVGAAASWPLAARGQQAALPVIGILGTPTAKNYEYKVARFLQALRQAGFVEGQNLEIQSHWADDQYDRLPGMAAELIRRRVTVIVTFGNNLAARAVKDATTSIPIVFVIGADPVQVGLVPSLGRPSGNVTGVTLFASDLVQKRLQVLHDAVPGAKVIGFLENPDNAGANASSGRTARELAQEAVRSWQGTIEFAPVRRIAEFETAFARLAAKRVDAIATSGDSLFTSGREQLVALAVRHAMPVAYSSSETVDAGGLVSYGADEPDVYVQAGRYAARILRGEKPADLPVLLPTKFTFAINLKTAKALGLDIPATVLARADEVIE
jgi:putative ABC transport system substrate-binding protein